MGVLGQNSFKVQPCGCEYLLQDLSGPLCQIGFQGFLFAMLWGCVVRCGVFPAGKMSMA